MAKVAYSNRTSDFRGGKAERVAACARIAEEYHAKGYVLTVRQLYYQLVSRDLVENSMRSYQQVVIAVLDGRMLGLIDWDAVEDRTREVVVRSRWNSPGGIVAACAAQYHEDLWVGQKRRVCVVVEKEALAGVLEPVCQRWDVPFLAARGYASASVVRSFALAHLVWAARNGQETLVLYLGDHDPSGMDMPNDLGNRIRTFCGADAEPEVKRIALNMPQVEELRPPENPAKQTDARFQAYQEEFGDSSWELDALPPEYLERLVEQHVSAEVNRRRWQERVRRVEEGKAQLRAAAEELT